MNLKDIMLSEVSWSQREILDDSIYKRHRVVKLIETQGRMVVARGWGKEGQQVSVLQDKNILEMDCST